MFIKKYTYSQSYFKVTTIGENGTIQPCVFPFEYKGKLNYECITIDKSRAWCATTAYYNNDGKWGYCQEIKCFKIVEKEERLLNAKEFCLQENARLASISNDYEQSLQRILVLTIKFILRFLNFRFYYSFVEK